jgi:uncharacterized ion transporter superfamily protein YfcC
MARAFIAIFVCILLVTGFAAPVAAGAFEDAVAADKRGDIPQNVNFAIKASVATAFLDAQRLTHLDSQVPGPLSTPDIAARAQALAVQVLCIR